jgi:hypothetical protein
MSEVEQQQGAVEQPAQAAGGGDAVVTASPDPEHKPQEGGAPGADGEGQPVAGAASGVAGKAEKVEAAKPEAPAQRLGKQRAAAFEVQLADGKKYAVRLGVHALILWERTTQKSAGALSIETLGDVAALLWAGIHAPATPSSSDSFLGPLSLSLSQFSLRDLEPTLDQVREHLPLDRRLVRIQFQVLRALAELRGGDVARVERLECEALADLETKA